ncbi:hypothetical protein RB195_024083 [Necator americanus]|uniref:Uncharacterized protein n=1 Tax=Necator americanus TaxID=51031 RepID=A0ABR1ELS9_NECAM
MGLLQVRLREKGFRSMTDIREEVKADLINTSTRQLGFAQVRFDLISGDVLTITTRILFSLEINFYLPHVLMFNVPLFHQLGHFEEDFSNNAALREKTD